MQRTEDEEKTAEGTKQAVMVMKIALKMQRDNSKATKNALFHVHEYVNVFMLFYTRLHTTCIQQHQRCGNCS